MSEEEADLHTAAGANDNDEGPLSLVHRATDDKSAQENKFQQAIASWRSMV